MIEIQQVRVAERIAELNRVAEAVRAERARGHVPRGEPEAPRGVASRRIRVGNWLVGLGLTVAGIAPDHGRSHVSADAADSGDPFAHAA